MALGMGFRTQGMERQGERSESQWGFELVMAWLPLSGGKPIYEGKRGLTNFTNGEYFMERITGWKERGLREFLRD